MVRRAGLARLVLNPGVPVDPMYRALDAAICTFDGPWFEYRDWSGEDAMAGDGQPRVRRTAGRMGRRAGADRRPWCGAGTGDRPNRLPLQCRFHSQAGGRRVRTDGRTANAGRAGSASRTRASKWGAHRRAGPVRRAPAWARLIAAAVTVPAVHAIPAGRCPGHTRRPGRPPAMPAGPGRRRPSTAPQPTWRTPTRMPSGDPNSGWSPSIPSR